MSGVRVRFAPSPTGVLHIGSVRTALFNWLYARHNDGKFLLRIEDTDKTRSTQENVDSIFKILEWLKIDFDDTAVIQSQNIERHKQIVQKLISDGKAYYCYCSQETIAAKREEFAKKGRVYKYDRACREGNIKSENLSPVVRLKMPTFGSVTLPDLVQGDVTVENSQLDDFILLRADGTPTYMLSVVVDDHDMGITHVIRGDDHLTNTFKQIQIYKACGWEVPEFAHIPLIYGPDGAKLSKRHGAVSAEDYRALGFLPEAISNYLLRLGWGHGDEEIIPISKAVAWFDINDVRKSPSRFDINKLQNLNSSYLRMKDSKDLFEDLFPFIEKKYGHVPEESKNLIKLGLNSLKERAKTLVDLADSCDFYIKRNEISNECLKFGTKEHIAILQEFQDIIRKTSEFKELPLSGLTKSFTKDRGIKLVDLAQALRGALTGRLVSPSVFEIMEVIGREESLVRISLYIQHFSLL